MRGVAFHVGVFGFGLVAGLGSMWLLHESDDEREGETSAAVVPARSVKPLVCTRVARPTADSLGGDVDLGGAAEARALVAEARLAACEHERRRVRHVWDEEGPTSEHPDGWVERVEEAIDACAIPVELEVVDCTEYPCVAGLKPTRMLDPSVDRERMAEQLDEQLDACDGLREAFAVDDQGDALQIHALDVPCDDGRTETTYALVALDTRGAAWKAWNERDRDPERVLRWMFRRGDDLAAISPCGDQPAR